MPYCPYCGAQDYGTPFCVSCQKAIPRADQRPPDAPSPSAPAPAEPRLAGFWRRFLALLADYLILSLVADIARMAYGWGIGKQGAVHSLNTALGLSVTIGLIYFTLLVGDGGQTLGKRLFDLRVVRADGQDVSYGRALLRALGYYLSAVPLLLGFLWAAWDSRKQAWHDKIADTVVVRV